jgi:hypothetical protein
MSANVSAGGKSANSMLVQDKHRRLIFRLSILSRLLIFVLVHLSASLLPLFDSSPVLVELHPLLRPLFRWDVFHFSHIARHSYVYEHEWAFFPSLPFIMRYDRLALTVLACDSSQMLYTLSLYHLPSPSHALLATLLSLLPSNPVTAYFAPYTEPFFNYFSYWGMSNYLFNLSPFKHTFVVRDAMLHQATVVLRLCPLCIRRNVQIHWYISRWFYYLGFTWPSSPESTNGKAITCTVRTLTLRPISPTPEHS